MELNPRIGGIDNSVYKDDDNSGDIDGSSPSDNGNNGTTNNTSFTKNGIGEDSSKPQDFTDDINIASTTWTTTLTNNNDKNHANNDSGQITFVKTNPSSR